jgi:hypothetical protein
MNQANSTARKRMQFRDRGWGVISMVSKNWKLFVAHLSDLWLSEILLDHPKRKYFPPKQKNWGKQMGWTP